MNYELREYSFGETIGKTFNLYFNNFLIVIGLSLLANIPVTLLYVQSAGTTNGTLNGFLWLLVIPVNMITSSFLSGVMIHIISKKFLDKEVASSDFFKKIYPMILPILGLSIMVGLVTILASLALVIPGIIVALGYMVATNVLVIERKGIFESMKRSWELTKGYKGTIFGLSLVIGLITLLFSTPVQLLLPRLNLGVQLTTLMSQLTSVVTEPLSSCLSIVVYFNLRIRKEGFNVEHLVQQYTLGPLPGTSTT